MVKILLADDHFIIRESLERLIQGFLSYAIIDYAIDGKSAMDKIHDNDYNLIILDINMPNADAVTLVTGILTAKPEARILMFSMNSEQLYAKKFLQLGVMGYLNKSAPPEDISRAINSILDNRRYVSSSLLQVLTKDMLEKRAANAFLKLSKREFEILRCFIVGESWAEISIKTGLHSSTVATYKARILEKLGCRDMTEAAALGRLYDIY
jgi:two-component system invasion response regulator UvrY